MDNVPTETGEFYGTGTADARSLQIARSQAAAVARATVAQQFRIEITASTDVAMENSGGEDPMMLQNFETISQELLDEELYGITVQEYYSTENATGMFRVFCLVSMDSNAMADYLDDQMRNQEAMEARWMASELRERHLDNIRNLRNRRNENPGG